MSKWLIRLVATMIAAAGIAVNASAIAAPCQTGCLTPGDHDFSFQQGLYTRTFRVHVPAGYDGTHSVALTLDIHGHALTSSDQQTRSGQQKQSDQLGFIVVWPQGIGNSWNGDGCCTTAYDLNIDDVGFLLAVVVQVEKQANIDPAKVYATGWSNGGGMAERLGCEAADVFHAIASVAHPLNRNDCVPSQPVSVLDFHGTADTVIPYDGGNTTPGVVLPRETLGIPLGWQSALASLAAWKVIIGCTDQLTQTQLNGGSRDQIYANCRGNTVAGLVTIANGQHDLYTPDYSAVPTGTPGVSWVDVAPYIWSHVLSGNGRSRRRWMMIGRLDG